MAAPPKQSIEWLMGELPGLIGREVIDEATAERLRAHYAQEVEAPPDRRWAFILFSAMGALLIGAGVILMVAHNWSFFGREARAAIALLPVFVGEGLVAYTLARRKDSAAWREGSALFLALAGGAALALVSQTYQWDRDLKTLLAMWGCMTVAIVYLLNGSAAAVLGAGIFCAWGFALADGGYRLAGLHQWVGLAAVVPHAAIAHRANPDGARFRFLGFTLPAIGAISLFPVQAGYHSQLWIPLWICYAATLWLWDAVTMHGRVRPVCVFASALLVILCLILGFRDPWDGAGGFDMNAALPGLVFTGAWFAAALGFGVWAVLRRKGALAMLVAAAPPLVVCALVFGLDRRWSVALAQLTNLYLLAFGALIVRQGLRTSSLKVANLGMLAIVLLAVFRFFDQEWSFIARGVCFFAVGAGFLLVNMTMSRSPKKIEESAQ